MTAIQSVVTGGQPMHLLRVPEEGFAERKGLLMILVTVKYISFSYISPCFPPFIEAL